MRKHKNWISAYLRYSQFSEAPEKFHFWTAVSVLAGAVRRKIWIDQKYFQWTPNFYIVFVAPPGIVSKSTTASIGMNLLKEIPEIHFGPDAVTWQSLVQSLGKSTETFLWNDLHYPMSAVTISSSEFGTFLNPQDREMVDVLVSLWDGQIGVFEKATKTQGDDKIENPWINLIACTTPSWIAGNFPEYMIGGGFTSRTVFVYAEEKRTLVAYPKDHIPENFDRMKKDLLHDLEIIASQIAGEVELSKAATDWGVQWYEEHYENKPVHLDGPRFGGYLARKQTHIHKLALILMIAESSDLIIQEHHLQIAAQEVDKLELDMPKVFANIGKSELTTLTEELRHFVFARRSVCAKETYRHFMDRCSDADFQQMLNSIFRTGQFVSKAVDGKIHLVFTG